MKQPIFVIGSGGHAGVIIDAINKGSTYEVFGLLDDFETPGASKHGHRIFGSIESGLAAYPQYDCFVAVGDISGRDDIITKVGTFKARIIHPQSIQALSSTISPGCFLAAGSVVGHGCYVGAYSIINTNASLDHDSTMGDFSHLAPGAVTGGHVTIGRKTLIGIGAMIRNGVSIGDNCVIGVGAVVVDDVPDGEAVVGNPAHRLR